MRPARAGPTTASGVSVRPSGSVIDSPRWSFPRSGPFGHAERVGRLDVEAARPLVLDERVADGGHAVRDREDEQLVVVALERLARRAARRGRARYGSRPKMRREVVEEVAEAGRPVDRERHVAVAERERLQHPRQAEVVVAVEVREEDLAQVDEADVRAQQLSLRPLAAVEEQPVAAAADEQRRRRAARGRRAARRAEEDEVEIHCGRSYSRLREGRAFARGAGGAGTEHSELAGPTSCERRQATAPRRTAQGKSRRSPGWIVAPERWFSFWIRHTASRTSPL